VTLWAKGGQSGGQASLSVNGSPAPPAQALTTNTLQPYTFDANLPAGGAELSVTASGTGTGHNAIVDYVTFPASGGTPPAQCNDTLDNDSDGLIDFPNDPGCLSATDNDETDETNAAAVTTARLVGAGDIGSNGDADIATGNLIDARPNARVFTAGDNAYHDGTLAEFQQRYHPAWGSFMNRTSPTPGNHDWHTAGAQGYKSYFGNVAGLRTVNPTTWYAYNLGAWRIYALDSESSMAARSAQYTFVQEDLNRNRRACMAAIWHHPIASSGQHGNEANARAMFALMDQAVNDVDLVINGHDHNYERFAKINSNGQPDPAGIREIVVGTGGTKLRGQGFVQPGSEKRNFNTHGIVDINLSSTGYSGRFVPVAGKTFADRFSGTCGT
jgi:Calcineurin-like phosphoesterase